MKRYKTWQDLVIAVYGYPQFADDWRNELYHRAIADGYVRLRKECAEGHCVDVLHITYKGKLWYRSKKQK